MIYIKKKLIIFFLSIIPILFTYKLTLNTNYLYVSIGDDLAKGHTPFNTYSSSYTTYIEDYLKTKYKSVTVNTSYIEEDLRIKDLINSITNPNPNDSKNITQAIKKADLITISVGSEELFSKLRSNIESTTYTYIDNLVNDYNTLLNEINKINKNKIYIIGYYNPIPLTDSNNSYLSKIFNYINKKFSLLETSNIKYIPLYNAFTIHPEYLPNSSFPSLDGYNYISNEIIKSIENKR